MLLGKVKVLFFLVFQFKNVGFEVKRICYLLLVIFFVESGRVHIYQM